jgi:neutral ceramidase
MISRLKAGVAEVDITPEVGIELAAELNPRISRGVRTPLLAKALALSDGETTLVVATVDLYGLQREILESIARRVGQQGHAASEHRGLSPDALMILSSHTRGGPYTTPVVGWPSVNSEYAEKVAVGVAEAAGLALDMLQDASLGLGRAMLPHLVYNHRLMTRNMKAVTAWMGVPRDEVLEPEGPIDPEFNVFVVRDNRGHPVCLLWSFAADNRFPQDDEISAGLPYFVQQEVDERLGRHVPCLCLPGCAGNTSFTFGLEGMGQATWQREEQAPAYVTDAVASAVMAVQLETPCDPMVRLGWAAERAILPVRDHSRLWSRADIELKCPSAMEAYDQEIALLEAQGARAVPATVQAFRLGRFALVGMAGMPFVEFALGVKAASPAAATVVAGNANAHLGYVITRAAFEHGGFEAWPARSALVGPGGGEFMADAAVRLLKELWRK